jgi:hypothetical protein
MTSASEEFTDEEFTELVDAEISRVDLVDAAANGTRFLIAKAAHQPSSKEKPMPRTATRPRLVRKADKKALAAAYDQTGKLIGLVDPDEITPIADLSAPEEDLDPVPAGEVGTPADEVGKRASVLKKSVYRSTDVAEQNRVAEHLNAAAIAGLRIIHGRRAA